MQIKTFSLTGLMLLGFASNAAAQSLPGAWQVLQSSDGSNLSARHEAAGVVIGDDIYLIGGRGNRPVERFSLKDKQWENLGLAPLEMHHAQPVVIGDDIYIAGAFTCCYPRETIVAEIHVLDTLTNTWDVVGTLPTARLRGSTAAVTHAGKLYVLGGNTRGHDGGAVAWFDEYDPQTGQWRVLPDAPNARDHFSAVMIGNELVAASGRQTTLPNPAANPVQPVDIYDFETGLWRSGASIPTVRGGAVAAGYGIDVIVAGGEINTSNQALNVVEAYDVSTDTWRSLSAMTTGRHGSGGGVSGRQMFMLSGASTIGGAAETTTAETLQLPELLTTPTDPIDPDTGDPDTGDPDTGDPDTGDPDTGDPGTGDPDTGDPDTGDPDTVVSDIDIDTEGEGNTPAELAAPRSSRGGALGLGLLLTVGLNIALRRR